MVAGLRIFAETHGSERLSVWQTMACLLPQEQRREHRKTESAPTPE